MPLTYDKRTGQYRGERGQFVPRSRVVADVEAVSSRLTGQLEREMQSLINGKQSLVSWQTRTARLLRDAHLQMGLLAYGGKNQIKRDRGDRVKMHAEIRRLLKAQEKALAKFARQLRDGKVTEAQALARIRNYGRSPLQAWNALEHGKRPAAEFWQAKRSLDPQAKHCADCLLLHTNGQWLPTDQVVPPGQQCRCRTRCRCQIAYRKFMDVINGKLSLVP